MTTLSPLIKQSWYVSSVMLSMLGMGMGFGFTSCLLLALADPDCTIVAGMETISWLVASLGFGSMFGHLPGAILMDIFGRRTTYGIILLPAVVGMLLTFCADDIITLICGRFLTGITTGATITVGSVVIGEYCSPQYRGMFLNMKTALVYLGSLFVHGLGYHIHWKTVALLCSMPYALALIVTYTWPESPSWLAQQRRFRESEEVFYHLRGTSEICIREIKELVRAQKAISINKRTFLDKITEIAKKFTNKNFLKPMLIIIFTAILLETSGRHIFPMFGTQIIIKITGNNSQTYYYTLVVDILITVTVLFSAYLIKVVKLRKLLFGSGLVSCVVLSLACLHLFLVEEDVISKSYSAVPTSLFGIFLVFANVGCAPVPLALLGEIFPLEHRAIGTCVSGFIYGISFTIGIKIMPIMLYTTDVYGAFAILALCMALSLLVLYFILPETKDKTLLEIEEFFNNGKVIEEDAVKCGKEDDTEDVELMIVCKKESVEG